MRTEISNEEFVKVFGHLDTPMDKLTKEQQDNHKTMRKVTNKYTSILDEEEIKSCMLQATLRCLKHHEENRGNKFTTSLWRFITWECKREASKKYKALQNKPISMDDFKNFDVPGDKEGEEIENIRDCISLLPDNDKQLIQEYYFDKRTMEEIGTAHNYTKEAARQKIKKAVSKLKELYVGVL